MPFVSCQSAAKRLRTRVGTRTSYLLLVGWCPAIPNDPMELRHLRYFVTVADELSVTRGRPAAAAGAALPDPPDQESGGGTARHTFSSARKRRLDPDGGRGILRWPVPGGPAQPGSEEDVYDLRSHSRGESKPLKIGYMLDMQYDLLPDHAGGVPQGLAEVCRSTSWR